MDLNYKKVRDFISDILSGVVVCLTAIDKKTTARNGIPGGEQSSDWSGPVKLSRL